MSAQTIRIAHSPDSDDAFMFYAMTHGLLDDDGLDIRFVFEDIESLNQAAFKGAPTFMRTCGMTVLPKSPARPPSRTVTSPSMS